MKKNSLSMSLAGCFFLISFFSFHSEVYPAASSYFDTVQKIYIGYYQRPADPAGLIYWAGRLNQFNGNLTEIIDAFATSKESQDLYLTIDKNTIADVVNEIYLALFNRPAETTGLNWYVAEFNAGRVTAATIMLNVLNGATSGPDFDSVNNKVTAANLFTRSIDFNLDGSNFQATYGKDQTIAARNYLTLKATSTTVPTQADTTAYIKANIAILGDPILSVANAAPVANAGTDQSVVAGAMVTLDGSASSDANGDPLEYRWDFTAMPSSSSATLSNPSVVKPTFTVDVAGTYTLSLVVNDGKENSAADTASIHSIPNTGSITVKW